MQLTPLHFPYAGRHCRPRFLQLHLIVSQALYLQSHPIISSNFGSGVKVSLNGSHFSFFQFTSPFFCFMTTVCCCFPLLDLGSRQIGCGILQLVGHFEGAQTLLLATFSEKHLYALPQKVQLFSHFAIVYKQTMAFHLLLQFLPEIGLQL